MPLIARIKVLHRWMELRAFCAELFDRALELTHRVWLPGIDRGEERETLRMPLDDRANKVVCEWRAVRLCLGLPGVRDAKNLPLGEFDRELSRAALAVPR